MKVTWRVEDGYIGNGEHTTIIEDSAFEGMDAEEKQLEIEEWVKDDMDQNVSFEITHIDGKKV